MSILDSYGGATISLPPPEPSKGHRRSRTTVDLPPHFSRTPSLSPTRSSTFMPFGRNSRDPSPNPWCSADSTASDYSSTEPQRKVKPGTVGKIASWFEGSSEPVHFGLVPSPRKEKPDPFYQLDYPRDTTHENITNMDSFTKRPQSKGSNTPNIPNGSRFSFFRKTTATPVKADPDELARLDIREALLPSGHVAESTPASFKALQLSAESLLRKFQTVYVENLNVLKEITSEKSIQADELEAEKTRNEHLKLQLLEMAEKASEQERIIASLKSSLAEPQPSIRMVDDHEHFTSSRRALRNRISDFSASDASSFVDSEASSAVSIFSDVESVETPLTSTTASPRMKHASLYSPKVIQGPYMQPQIITPVLVSECQKCHNIPTSEAWDVIEIMKMESVALKERIAELETAQDSALDLLTALRI